MIYTKILMFYPLVQKNVSLSLLMIIYIIDMCVYLKFSKSIPKWDWENIKQRSENRNIK